MGKIVSCLRKQCHDMGRSDPGLAVRNSTPTDFQSFYKECKTRMISWQMSIVYCFFSSKGMLEEAPSIFMNNSHGVSFIKIIMWTFIQG